MPVLAFPGPVAPPPPSVAVDADYDVLQSVLETIVVGGAG
jgi:hypothetical protein